MLRIGKSLKVEQPNRESGAIDASAQHATSSPQPSTQIAYQSPVTHRSTTTDMRVGSDKPITAPRAVSESEALARDLKDGIMSGFVGSGTLLTGEASFKGMLRVDGHFSGHISSDKGTLIVSSGGLVDANIEVAIAKINGTINGDMIASERIEMGRNARVKGNVQTPVLVVEPGAIFEGNCRMPQPRAAQISQRPEQLPDDGAHADDLRSPIAEDISLTPDTANIANIAS